jgi:hypothetical protein
MEEEEIIGEREGLMFQRDRERERFCLMWIFCKKKLCLSHALHTTDMSMVLMAIQYNIKLNAWLIQLIWTKKS